MNILSTLLTVLSCSEFSSLLDSLIFCLVCEFISLFYLSVYCVLYADSDPFSNFRYLIIYSFLLQWTESLWEYNQGILQFFSLLSHMNLLAKMFLEFVIFFIFQSFVCLLSKLISPGLIFSTTIYGKNWQNNMHICLISDLVLANSRCHVCISFVHMIKCGDSNTHGNEG